jgi:hypothetical protein
MLGVHFRRWTLNMNYEKLILLVKHDIMWAYALG